MIEKEIERCRVVEYRRAAAISTGVPSASPMTKGNNPPASARQGIVVNTIIERATRQIMTPRKKVRRRPSASVSEPDNSVNTVIAGAQTHPIKAPAAWSLYPRSAESHKINVLFVIE